MDEKIVPTPVEATRTATAAALDAADGTPAENTAPNAEETAKNEDVKTDPSPAPEADNTIPADKAEAAAKAPEATKTDEEAKKADGEDPEDKDDDEDIDAILDKKEPKIPAYRLKKKADQAKKAETEAEKLRRENAEKDEKIAALEAKKQSDGNDPDEDDEDDEFLTPEGEKALRERGYVKKDEVLADVEAMLEDREERSTMRTQIRQDVTSLSKWADDNGYPAFKLKDIVAYAEAEFGPEVTLTGKNMKAAYISMNQDAIVEAGIKARIAQAENPASAEKPGAKAQTPAASVAGGSSDGSWRERVSEVVDSSQ